MTHAIAQIHCCHWDLGSFMVVCGESLGGSTRNRLPEVELVSLHANQDVNHMIAHILGAKP
jgi:hypothetical protein